MSMRRANLPSTVSSLLIAVFLVTACAAPGAPSPSPTCTEAFATAVAVGTGDEGVAFNALRPVFAACATVEEWTTEWTRHNGLGFVGTPAEVLGQLCQQAEVKDSRLCVAARSTP